MCCWSVFGDGEFVLDMKWIVLLKASVFFLFVIVNGDFSRAVGFCEMDFVVYFVSD